MNEKKHILEYDILRVGVTLLVVVSHCMYYRIESAYGGIDYARYVSTTPFIYRCLEQIKEMLYAFHMPLFMGLSGALFKNGIQKRNSLKNLLKKKFERLIIPFIIVTIVYDIPLKYISQYWDGTENFFKDAIIGQLLIQGNTYLWFLPTLFFIFAIYYEVEKINIPLYIQLVGFAILNILQEHITNNLIKNICIYLLWFCVGYWFEKVRSKIKEKISLKIMICNYLIFVILFYGLKHIELNSIFDGILKIVLALLGMLATYMTAVLLTKTKVCQNILYGYIKKYSFGIYLYSDPINYVLLFCEYSVFGGMIFNTNMGAAFLFFSRFIISLLIAILISAVLKKCHFKYLY